MAQPRIAITGFDGAAAPFVWTLRGGNHRELGRGARAWDDAETARLEAERFRSLLDQVESAVEFDDETQDWRWQLRNAGHALATAHRGWGSRREAQAGLATFLKAAADVPVQPVAVPTLPTVPPVDTDRADTEWIPTVVVDDQDGRPTLLLTANGNGASEGSRGARLDAVEVCAWFGSNLVLDRVSLSMSPGTVTALIGPSGCGKSTFLRILNRMHELVPSAKLAGEVLLDGEDIYAAGRRITDTRKRIGMVFQKPNPFPTMSIYENVIAGLKMTGTKIAKSDRDDLVESSLRRGGLWAEVKDRLNAPGGSLSGGQQQRLCIARSLAVRPDVLLMDEPCSALDPTSTRRVEETIAELSGEVTIVIVTHNMQQAARVSHQSAFFLAENGNPGRIVEFGATEQIFDHPVDERTRDYVNGRFG